jgi:hypothetical protein
MRGFVSALLLLAACGSSGDVAPDANTTRSATAHYAPPPPTAGGDWGRVPYPNDLYLDATGHVALTSLPTGPHPDAGHVAMMIDGLSSMNGAGLRSNVYFPIDVAPGRKLDAATFADGAHLVDVEGGIHEIAADVYWREDLGDLVIVPKLGTVLAPTHHYAAYLTDDLHTDDGKPVSASPNFLDAIGTAPPQDGANAAAQVTLQPLMTTLDAGTRSRLVDATVFVTAGYVTQTQRMRDIVAASPPTIHDLTVVSGAALDSVFGAQTADAVAGTCAESGRAQPHNRVAMLVHGTIDLTSFLSAQAGVDGFPQYDANLQPIVQGTYAVPFSLTLPVAASYANVPVLLYVHGLGRTRVDMLTQANDAARLGMAVLAIDLPYHGSRALRPPGQQDVVNETTDAQVPDGFGDNFGTSAVLDLFHFDNTGGIPAEHPRAMGENLRAAAIEVSELVAFVKSGNHAPLSTAIGQSITFRSDVGLLTESLGGMITGVTLAVEPDLGVAYLSAPAAGFPEPSMVHSPNFSAAFGTALTAPFDLADRVDGTAPETDWRVDPIVMLYGNVVERGDAIAYAPLVTSGALRGGKGPDLVVAMAWGDVWVSNDTQEAYAKALGLGISTMAASQPPSQPLRYVDLAAAPWPVAGNRPGGATGCFVVFNPAGHSMLRRYEEERDFQPTYPPYVAVTPPTRLFPDQEAQIHDLWGKLMATHFGGHTTLGDPYADDPIEQSGSSCP